MRKTTTKRVTRKAASKKRRSNKAPSAKQLAARRKFALAAKARSKAAKAKKATKRARNKTIISKPKRVIVLNPGSMVKRKIGNSYVSLKVHGYAKKVPTGWSFASKTYPQGTGIVPITRKGFYLDKGTGAVFSRKVANPKRKYSAKGTPKLSRLQTLKKKEQLLLNQIYKFQRDYHKATTDKQRYELIQKKHALERSLDAVWKEKELLFQRGENPAAKASPKVKALREKFTGTKSRKTTTMNVANGTPKNLAKLGKLVLIKAQRGTIKPASGTTWLCADAKGKLHLATTAARLYDGPAMNFGEVTQIEYEAQKPHLGHPQKTIFFHKMGEEGGKKPTLIGDGNGGLKLRGGSYRIEREGIVD